MCRRYTNSPSLRNLVLPLVTPIILAGMGLFFVSKWWISIIVSYLFSYKICGDVRPALLSNPSLLASSFANFLPSFQTMNRQARHCHSVAMNRYLNPPRVMFPWSLAYKAYQTEVVRFGLEIVISALTRSNILWFLFSAFLTA